MNKFKRSYRNASINSKFFLVYLSVLIIPTVILMLLMIRYLSNSAKKEAYYKAQVQLTRMNEQINDRLVSAENVSTIALGQHEFLNFVSGDMKANDLNLIRFKQKDFRQMESIVRSNPLIEKVSFYISNPKLYEIWHLIYDYDARFPDKDYGQRLLQTSGSRWEFFSLSHPDSLAYYRSVPLYQNTTFLPTILEVRISHSELLDNIVSAENEYPTFILSEKGEVVGNTQEWLTEVPLNDLEQSGTAHVSLDDREVFVKYHPKLRIYLLSEVALKPLLRPIQALYPIIGLTTVALLLLLLVMLRLLTRRMFRRMDRLHESMSMVSQGDMAVKVHTGLLEGESGDVIDSLAENYNRMLDEIGRLMEEAVDRELVSKDAQLHALQNQIHSHFLYNALESIRMLAVEEEQEQISDALVTLGQLMRYSFRWRSDIVELRAELNHIKNYISFINFMEEGSFVLDIAVPEHYLTYEIPKMSIQPLVENVVQHAGFGEPITIRIEATMDEDRLLLRIRDNGSGILEEELQELRKRLRDETLPRPLDRGVGLENVHRRLRLQHGNTFGLSITSEPGIYTEVSLHLPRQDQKMGGW